MKNKKIGRPLKQIDYKQLDGLCAIQCTIYEAAAVLGMDMDTLNRALERDGNGRFTDYYAIKSQGGKASLRRRQYKIANEGNPTMLIWLGKQWLGQGDKPSEHNMFEVESDGYDEQMKKATARAWDNDEN